MALPMNDTAPDFAAETAEWRTDFHDPIGDGRVPRCRPECRAAVTGLPRPVMLFSGGCRFCRFAARVVARLDLWDELAVVPLGDEVADRLLANVEPERRTECWWFVLPTGVPVEGDRGGGVALLSHLRLTRPIGRLLARSTLSRHVDRLDAWLAEARRGLSRFVPDGPAPRRYP